MRLRPLSEAECYARCYARSGDERVSFVRVLPRTAPRMRVTGEQLRALFEERLETHGPEAEAA